MIILRVRLHGDMDVHGCKFEVWLECKLELIECCHATIYDYKCATTNNHNFMIMKIMQSWNGKYCYNNSKQGRMLLKWCW